MHTDCVIIGGGAAGLTACAALAEKGLRIALVERLDRVGKKILSTGNGRCNLSNEDMNPAYYGEASDFVSRVYAQTPPGEVLAFFDRLGLMTSSEDGRIYPRTMAASSVLDVLRNAIEQKNVTVMTGEKALSITPSRRGGFCVQLESGESLMARLVICAAGGSAAPSMGTDGSAVQLLTQLGHSASKTYPALVQLKSSHRALKSLKGVRVQAALELMIDGSKAASETGELLFADYGVSGVCVFQLSRHVAKAVENGQHVSLRVNLLPELASDTLDAWLEQRIRLFAHASADKLFTGVFHRLLAQALLKEAEIPLDLPAHEINATQKAALIRAVSCFTLHITGTQGFAQAQVTRGGLSLADVDPRTMASKLYDGLYILGETLDVDGPCGGYNLHFAFASALTACKAITETLI